MTSVVRVAAIALFFAALAGCGGSATAPSSSRIAAALRQAPGVVTVGGVTIELVPYVWRDFTPGANSLGSPLMAVLSIKGRNGAALPTTIGAPRAWVVWGEQVWGATPQEYVISPPDSSTQSWTIRGGPKWPTGERVDIVLELRVDGAPHRLRTTDQLINHTW